MPYGLPAVAPNRRYFGEVLDDEGAILYDPSAVDLLSDALSETLKRRSDLPGMGEHNMSLVAQWHRRDIAIHTNAVYTNVIPHRES